MARELIDEFFDRMLEDCESTATQEERHAQYKEYRKAAFYMIAQFGAALDEALSDFKVTIQTNRKKETN